MSKTYVELDVSDFGNRELRMMRDLLTAYLDRTNETRVFNDLTKIGFNLNSGYVFLLDDDNNCAMDSNGKLYDFLTCPECGNEGLSFEFDQDSSCCREYFGSRSKTCGIT